MKRIRYILHWLNLVARLRARQRRKLFEAQGKTRDELADMFVTNPGLHARIMLIGKRHVHFLEMADLFIVKEAASDEPEFKCNQN